MVGSGSDKIIQYEYEYVNCFSGYRFIERECRIGYNNKVTGLIRTAYFKGNPGHGQSGAVDFRYISKGAHMPASLVIKMKGEDDKHHGPYLASLLQGVLMENIDGAYAGCLHKTGIHPYSQYVEVAGGDILWHIHTLTGEAEEAMIGPMRDDSLTEVELKHRSEMLRIIEKTVTRWSYEDLIEGYYLGECSRNIPLRIITPMSFKTNGRYCIIPSSRLLFQSLMMRFDACSPDSRIFTEELLQEFESLTEISDYHLRSVRYSLESVRIPAFLGDMRIHVNGPQQMANAAWMLARFGEYSGAGIKTGIGMGALSIEDRFAGRKAGETPDGGKGYPAAGPQENRKEDLING